MEYRKRLGVVQGRLPGQDHKRYRDLGTLISQSPVHTPGLDQELEEWYLLGPGTNSRR